MREPRLETGSESDTSLQPVPSQTANSELVEEEAMSTDGPRSGIRRRLRRYAVITVGFLLLAVGIPLAALPPIPGGTFCIISGILILSTELKWARRLRNKAVEIAMRFLPPSTRRLLNRMLNKISTKLKIGEGLVPLPAESAEQRK